METANAGGNCEIEGLTMYIRVTRVSPHSQPYAMVRSWQFPLKYIDIL